MKTIRSQGHQLGSFEIKKCHYLALMTKGMYWIMVSIVIHTDTIKSEKM